LIPASSILSKDLFRNLENWATRPRLASSAAVVGLVADFRPKSRAGTYRILASRCENVTVTADCYNFLPPPRWRQPAGKGRGDVMLTAQTIMPIIIEIACGAAGGIFLGWFARRLSLGRSGDAFVGAIGGLALTWLATRTPGISHFVGHVEQAADATAQSVGGLTPAILVGVGIAGLLGGILLTAVAGLVRNWAGS
jgi:hypothetical protein